LSVTQLWQIHVAEQMILDDLEANPEKYKDKKLSELTDDEDFDEENNVIYTKAYYKKSLIPKVILVSTALLSQCIDLFAVALTCLLCVFIFWQKTSVKELDLEAAFAEREVRYSLLFFLFSFFFFLFSFFFFVCFSTKMLAYLSHLMHVFKPVALFSVAFTHKRSFLFLFCWTAP
jgi:hypothetical protein